MDPYDPLGPLPLPFCRFGFAPTLFDAPWRDLGRDVDWTAHSFLAFTSREREACAVAGFPWGFGLRGGTVSIEGWQPLSPHDWDDHLALLGAAHPDWRFAHD